MLTNTPRILISDKLSPAAVKIFEERGLAADLKPGLAPPELRAIIGDYDGLAVRSATKVTRELLDAAPRLKVVGRAGIGVDNVDVKSATARGVVVMNTPFGNSITTAEHAIAMMFALARQIPEANASTKAGKWEKNRFMGVELFGKTLGVIGCGNIGAIVADRALGLKMKVIAYDPFLSEQRARELGVEKVDLPELLARAEIITLHTPLTEGTRNILDRVALAKTRKGVRIVNCARGGLIDEQALADAITAGHVAGAALDVFETEPATDSPLFGLEHVVCTPHLGAATSEAQENVALQIAEQMSDFLLSGAVANAINMPSISAEDAPRLRPYLELVRQLGAIGGQLTNATGRELKGIRIEYEGLAAQLNHRPLTAAAIAGVLGPIMAGVNMVNAPLLARERGIDILELVRQLGAIGGQLTNATGRELKGIRIEYEGLAAQLNHRPLTAAAIAGVLGPIMAGVNMVNAPLLARERGIDILETTAERASAYQTGVRLVLVTDRDEKSVSGTLFGDRPRLTAIKDISVEAELSGHMLYVTNQDKPGFIGTFGATLAEAGINIATFHLGRSAPGKDAVCLVAVDGPVSEEVLARVRAIPQVMQASALTF